MSRRAKAKPRTRNAKAQATGAADNVAPAKPSVEELRRSIARKLIMFAADWRRCPRGVCRRRRGCVPDDMNCAAPERPSRELTPEQDALMRFQLQRMIERRLAELAAPRGGGAK